MPRKKMKQAVKPKAKNASMKRPVKATGLTLVETLERDFKNTPTKLATLFNKELAALKQQEKKLKTKLNKALAQKKAAKNKRVTLAAKSTPAAKKQLITAKKAYDNLNTIAADLTADIEQINKCCKVLAQKQSKFIFINKQLLQIEKQFDVNTTKSVKTNPKKATKKTVKQTKLKSITPANGDSIVKQQELPATVSTPEPVEMDS